ATDSVVGLMLLAQESGARSCRTAMYESDPALALRSQNRMELVDRGRMGSEQAVELYSVRGRGQACCDLGIEVDGQSRSQGIADRVGDTAECFVAQAEDVQLVGDDRQRASGGDLSMDVLVEAMHDRVR